MIVSRRITNEKKILLAQILEELKKQNKDKEQ